MERRLSAAQPLVMSTPPRASGTSAAADVRDVVAAAVEVPATDCVSGKYACAAAASASRHLLRSRGRSDCISSSTGASTADSSFAHSKRASNDSNTTSSANSRRRRCCSSDARRGRLVAACMRRCCSCGVELRESVYARERSSCCCCGCGRPELHAMQAAWRAEDLCCSDSVCSNKTAAAHHVTDAAAASPPAGRTRRAAAAVTAGERRALAEAAAVAAQEEVTATRVLAVEYSTSETPAARSNGQAGRARAAAYRSSFVARVGVSALLEAGPAAPRLTAAPAPAAAAVALAGAAAAKTASQNVLKSTPAPATATVAAAAATAAAARAAAAATIAAAATVWTWGCMRSLEEKGRRDTPAGRTQETLVAHTSLTRRRPTASALWVSTPSDSCSGWGRRGWESSSSCGRRSTGSCGRRARESSSEVGERLPESSGSSRPQKAGLAICSSSSGDVGTSVGALLSRRGRGLSNKTERNANGSQASRYSGSSGALGIKDSNENVKSGNSTSHSVSSCSRNTRSANSSGSSRKDFIVSRLLHVACSSNSEAQELWRDAKSPSCSSSDNTGGATGAVASRKSFSSGWRERRSSLWVVLLLVVCSGSVCCTAQQRPQTLCGLSWWQSAGGVLALLLLSPHSTSFFYPVAVSTAALSGVLTREAGATAAAATAASRQAAVRDSPTALFSSPSADTASLTAAADGDGSSNRLPRDSLADASESDPSPRPAAEESDSALSAADASAAAADAAGEPSATTEPAEPAETPHKKAAAAGPRLDALGLPVKEKVYRAKLYGSMFSYAYYFLDILVGTPPQRASVILDTGSSLLAFPCKGCTDCGEHLDPAIDTGLTTTGEWVGCTEKERCFGTCSRDGVFRGKMRNEGRVSSGGRCMYSQTYSEGSSIRGIYMSDVVALGEREQGNPFVRYDFVGCHVEETNLFVTQKAAGIFGISFPKGHRQPTLLDVMFQHSELVDRKLFSICISEDGGLLTVGGYEPSLLVAPPETAPSTPAAIFPWPAAPADAVEGGSSVDGRNSSLDRMLTPGQASGSLPEGLAAAIAAGERRKTSPHYADLIGWTPIISHSTYRVLLERMEIEGLVLGHDREEFGNTMVDSGTTYSYFPPAVFARWRQFLHRLCTPELFCERERDGRLCWRVSPGTDLESLFPPIKVVFGFSAAAAAAEHDNENYSQPREQVVWWRPEGYLYRRTGGYFCDGFDDNRIESSVLGLSFFKNKLVIFDRERDRVGFAAAQCPSFFVEERPPGPSETRPPVNGGTAPDTVRSPASEGETAAEEGLEKVMLGAPAGSGTEEQVERRGVHFFSLSASTVWLLVGGFVLAIVLAMLVILYNTAKLQSFSQVVPGAALVPDADTNAYPAASAGKRSSRGSGGASTHSSSGSIRSERAASSSTSSRSRGSRGATATDEGRGRRSRNRPHSCDRAVYQTVRLTPTSTAASRATAAAKAAAKATTARAAKAGSHLSHLVQKAAAVSTARLMQQRGQQSPTCRHQQPYLDVESAQPFSPQKEESYYDMEAEGDSISLVAVSEEDGGLYTDTDLPFARGFTPGSGNETQFEEAETDEEQGVSRSLK